MKTTVFTILIGLSLAVGVASAQEPKAEEKAAAPKADGGLKSVTSRASYAIGMDDGKQMKPRVVGLELDAAAYLMGVSDSIKGDKSQLSDSDIEEAILAFRKVLMQKREAKMVEAAPPEIKAAAAKNKLEGEAYLAKNKAKAGVKTTASGLQYEVVKEGKGAIPKSTDTVKVHYTGTLINGTVFDSSVKKNMPFTTPVTRVIPGWVEALQLMKVGSKYKLTIPSDLAYGFSGQGEDIGPNSVLLFEIELLGIE